ncbi:DUF4367 domain-containing protein [Desulfosporosinus sp. FKA]|uniref:DUF4367 domain-containing protein n=1 Tax=Desulfosporosinus sp. FKA TaxID=1969834 RepID=UPI000B49C9B2|nr:DUF4367 domain-containing protein [Desulfosporosinus sp. FKA]
MALSEKEIDQLITDQMSKELTSSIEVPDVDCQWQKIKQRIIDNDEIPKQYKNHQTRKRVLITAAAIVISVVSLNFLYPSNANALGGKIAEFFNYIVGKTTQDKTETYSQPTDLGKPKLQDLSENTEKEVTLEQAQASIPFKLATPSYLPPETKTQRILLTSLGGDVYQVSIEYNVNDEVVIFNQQNCANSTSRGSLYDTDDTKVKDIAINGSPAILFMSKNGVNLLDWQERGLVLQIHGIITEEEITKIANSIK